MHFAFIDRITQLEAGKSITAIKALSISEDYLSDHFPLFPVMPGVLLLEAMTEAAAWLVRVMDKFSHSVITLKEARNVRYSGVVVPGQLLELTAEFVKQDGETVHLKTAGTVNGRPVTSARLSLLQFNLSDQQPEHANLDRQINNRLRAEFDKIYSVRTAP